MLTPNERTLVVSMRGTPAALGIRRYRPRSELIGTLPRSPAAIDSAIWR